MVFRVGVAAGPVAPARRRGRDRPHDARRRGRAPVGHGHRDPGRPRGRPLRLGRVPHRRRAAPGPDLRGGRGDDHPHRARDVRAAAPGTPVRRAIGAERDTALYFDRMVAKLPIGLGRDGAPLYANLEFLDGTRGAHVNISGISGVATKTSYATFLLYSLFRSGVLGAEAANTKALVFNVKGEDLLFLDQPNIRLTDDDRERYGRLGLPAEPFARRRLTSDVAHELRTPVATLSAYLEGIEDGVRDLDDATLDVFRSATARLARLAADLAHVTSAEAGSSSLRLERVTVLALASTAVAAVRPAFTAKGVSLEVASSPHVQVDADPERFGQILGNLLDNALRHTPSGGGVSLGWLVAGDEVVISVADTGEGIGPEHVDHVFERFYRADAARDRSRGGSGIGLAVVKGLVQAHGGRVEAASDGPGRGATFAVTLPCSTRR